MNLPGTLLLEYKEDAIMIREDEEFIYCYHHELIFPPINKLNPKAKEIMMSKIEAIRENHRKLGITYKGVK